MLVGFAVFVFCIAYMLNTLFIHPGKHVDFSIFSQFDIYRLSGLFFIVALLAVFNLLAEAYKWWYLVSFIETVSFATALKSILTGLAVGFITPNRLGDFPGRAMLFSPANRGKIILLNLLAGYSQFIVICLLAVWSIVLMPVDFSLFFAHFETLRWAYLAAFVLLVVYHVLFLFRTHHFLLLFARIKWLRPLLRRLDGFARFGFTENINALVLSFIRSGIYTAQLMLIIYFFDDSVSVSSLFLYTNLYFFVLTVAPSFMLNKLGVRESLAVLVFADIVSNPVVTVVSVLSLWIINQVIPAITGAVILFKKGRA